MYIESVPNRSSPPAVLLRESYRDGRRVKKRTLANLSKLPPAAIDMLRRVLRGEQLVNPDDAFTCVRSLPSAVAPAASATWSSRSSLPASSTRGRSWPPPAR